MVRVKEHLRSAEEFYETGMKEYQEGRRIGDLMRMREGCEKVFHAYFEACSALIQKGGLREPESHGERAEMLYKLGERRLVEIGRDALVFLHKYAYYDSRILPEDTEGSMKGVEEALTHVQRKVKKASFSTSPQSLAPE